MTNKKLRLDELFAPEDILAHGPCQRTIALLELEIDHLKDQLRAYERIVGEAWIKLKSQDHP